LNTEPEFVNILTYLQEFPPGTSTAPDYRYIKRSFLAIKDRKGFPNSLDWVAAYHIPVPIDSPSHQNGISNSSQVIFKHLIPQGTPPKFIKQRPSSVAPALNNLG